MNQIGQSCPFIRYLFHGVSEVSELVRMGSMHWYLVSTKTREEKVGEMSLHQLGVEVFCPLLKQEKMIRRKWRVVISPLFSGYLFARFDCALQFRAVHYATGIRKVVTFGVTPAKVDDEMIDAMKARISNGYVKVSSSLPFQPGQKVRIHDGPFSGMEAVFECEMSDRQRVALLLKAVSYQARVIVRSDYVSESLNKTKVD